MRSVGERPSDLSRSLVGEQQEQEHTAIVLTACRRRSLERRGLIRVLCRPHDRRRRSRDSAGGVAPGTQREHGNENMDDDESELPDAFHATFSLAPTHRPGVGISPPPRPSPPDALAALPPLPCAGERCVRRVHGRPPLGPRGSTVSGTQVYVYAVTRVKPPCSLVRHHTRDLPVLSSTVTAPPLRGAL